MDNVFGAVTYPLAFGNQIKHLHMDVFWKWLVRMPSLKHLKIGYVIKVDGCDIDRFPPVPRNLSLPNLEMLQNVEFLDVPGPIVHKILNNNRHIKSVEISRYQYELNNEDYLKDLPNLQNLEQFSTSVHTENDLKMLENCKKATTEKVACGISSISVLWEKSQF